MSRSVVPYLIVDGGHEAIDWYRDVFGAEEVSRAVGAAGRVAHAELRIGASVIYLGDEHPHLEDIFAPGRIGGSPVYLNLETDDVDHLSARRDRRSRCDPPADRSRVAAPVGEVPRPVRPCLAADQGSSRVDAGRTLAAQRVGR